MTKTSEIVTIIHAVRRIQWLRPGEAEAFALAILALAKDAANEERKEAREG